MSKKRMSEGHGGKTAASVAAFLEEVGFALDENRRVKELTAFRAAMEKGLDHPVDDMLMIPTWLSVPEEGFPATAAAHRIIVLDIGGSNVRVGQAVVTAEGGFEVQVKDRFPMPGKAGPCSKADFLNALADRIEPLWEPGCRIGLCFSYELDMQPDHDGRVIRFSKEVQLPELEGELLGANLLQTLRQRGLSGPCRIVLLNDTVAALLGGVQAGLKGSYESYIGLIIGTGTNTAYVERTDRISKIRTAPAIKEGRYSSGWMIINMESGGYRTEFRTSLDEALDRESSRPDHHRFEKMISGQYLGELVWRLSLAAAEAGLLSTAAATCLSERGGLATAEANWLLEVGGGAHGQVGPMLSADLAALDRPDLAVLQALSEAVFRRAARLTVIQLEGILQHTGWGRQASSPVLCTVEGTTYSKSKLYQAALAEELERQLMPQGYYLELVEVQDSNLVGAAVAALSD